MEFIHIEQGTEVEHYRNNGYTIIANISGFPLRLSGFSEDLYSGKSAAVKGHGSYLAMMEEKGKISLLHPVSVDVPVSPVNVVEVIDDAPKSKKKSSRESSISSESVADVSTEQSTTLPTDAVAEVSDENKDVEVQESAQ
jgi:hypothetical protein